jgi:DNA-directed RNA polymerase specialized sigma24 family protein
MRRAGRGRSQSADVALLARLREGGFQGSDWERFAEELVRYGLSVIGAWVRSGQIFEECRRRRIKGSPTKDRRELDDQGISELAELTEAIVAEAICSYREVLRRGGWSAERGASLTTFFIGQCLVRFPAAYRRWQKETRPAQWVGLQHDDGTSIEVEDPMDEVEVVIQRIEVIDRLRGVDDDRVRRILRLRMAGFSDREVGDRLGTTPKAVQALLYRYRRQLGQKGGDNGQPARAD